MTTTNYLSVSEARPIYAFLALILTPLFLLSCQDSVTQSDTPPTPLQTGADSLTTAESGSYVTLNAEPTSISDDRFRVYDAIGYSGKPDSDKMMYYGIKPMHVIYATHLWNRDISDIHIDNLPARDLLHKETKRASRINQYITMVDIEHWPTHGVSDYEVRESVKKYYRVVDRMEKIRPNLKIGFFGMVPVKNYNHTLVEEALAKWRSNNHKLRPLATKVGAFFLKGYTYWQDRDKWAKNLKNNITEARRLANDVNDPYKKVYVVLMPQYNWGFDYTSPLKGDRIGADYWRFQLETARKYADGIVIYAPGRGQWDGSDGWWAATKNFMKSIDKGKH